ncbi:Metallo-dependent phosphatase [Apiospora sp. TS-2023a]
MENLVSLAKGLPLLATCVLGLATLPAKPLDLTTPFQQRIAIKGKNAMSIGWSTYEQPIRVCVSYGTSADTLDMVQCSTDSETYSTSRTFLNTVTLSELTPATTYYYKIWSSNSTVEHFFSPRAPGDKTPFAVNAVVDLGVYGADGFTINMDETKRDEIPYIQPALNHTTIGAMAATVDDYELVLHPGDLAYADDWVCGYTSDWLPQCSVNSLLHSVDSFWEAIWKFPHIIKSLWYIAEDLLGGSHAENSGSDAFHAILETFYDQLAPIAARKPYMVGPGNHEATCSEALAYARLGERVCPEGQKNFTDFRMRFGPTMPSAFISESKDEGAQRNAHFAIPLAKPPFWYSFEYGMVHFVMIDTETDFPSAPDEDYPLYSGPFGEWMQQLAFLEADLASIDRTVTPWVVVSGHRPWYTTGGASKACEPCRAAFERLVYKYGVDLAIFGHVHNAQRHQPVYAGEVDPNGLDDPKAPMYIVTGGAGNVEGLAEVGEKPNYTAFAYADDFSYGKVSFLDANRLQVDFIRSSTGETLDSSVLYKSHKEQFVVQS